MKERITVYAAEPVAAVLVGYDESRSHRINQVCADYCHYVRECMPTLTREEWCAIMDATNGVFSDPGDTATTRFLWAEVADAEGLGEKWGIDQAALAAAVRAMALPQLLAIAEASRQFWAHTDQPTDAALKLAGVRLRGD